MAFLKVLDILMMILGSVGVVYQAICIVTSFVSNPVSNLSQQYGRQLAGGRQLHR